MKRTLVASLLTVVLSGVARAQDNQVRFVGFNEITKAFEDQEREIGRLRARLASIEGSRSESVGYPREQFVGERYVGEQYMGEQYVGQRSLRGNSMGSRLVSQEVVGEHVVGESVEGTQVVGEYGGEVSGEYVGEFGDEVCDADWWCNPCPGLVGSIEIVWLRPQDSEPNSSTSTEYQSGSRYELGWVDGTGRTFRGRIYEYHHNDFDNGGLTQRMFDLEYGGRFRLGCNWTGEVMGGFRWASYEDNDNDYDSTFGPVLGVEINTDIGCGVGVFGMVRQSYQFGTEKSSDYLGTFGISEMQIGLESHACICGYQMFGRFMMEAQYWSGVEDNESDDLGLIGLGFGFGFTR